MLPDATVNGIRNALEDQRKAAYRKYPVFTMRRASRVWIFRGLSPNGYITHVRSNSISGDTKG